MDKEQLRELAEGFLVPLISGAHLDAKCKESTKREALVALVDPCTIAFKAGKSDNYRLVLRRSQPFEKVTGGELAESNVLEAFVRVVQAMEHGLQSWYSADLRATFPRRVVAKALCSREQDEEPVLAAIDQLSAWAGQQYEGKPIPAAIGFVTRDHTGVAPFLDMCHETFSAVISNGLDTILTCNFGGEVVGHQALDPPITSPPFAPYRLAAISHWATNGRLALVLNRVGEILVFRDRQLCFTQRGGQWHFLTHEPVITQMGRPDDRNVRRAVYATSIDASFARTGACIGVVTSNHASRWKRLISDEDYLSPPKSIKAKVLASIVGTKKFHQLDRRLRQELVAIDGATVIDHMGTVLAAGAIVQVPGGSSGGGRLAAAKALSGLGLGIKVSQDGAITGFHDGNDGPKFMVM
jgi:hypothetical protein